MLMNSKESEVRITSVGSLTDILTSILKKSNSKTSVKCLFGNTWYENV